MYTLQTINSNSFIDAINIPSVSLQTIEIIVFSILKLIKQPICRFLLISSFIDSYDSACAISFDKVVSFQYLHRIEFGRSMRITACCSLWPSSEGSLLR